MRLLKEIFNKADPYFNPKGKFSKFRGIYHAAKTFFFFPSPLTHFAPHIRDNLDLKRFMSFVIIALIPVTLFGIYNTGYQFYSFINPDVYSNNNILYQIITFFEIMKIGASYILPIILVSYTVGFFWEILFATIRKHEVTEGFLITGLLFPLTLPPTIPLWQVAVGISFGIVIGKEVFGGTGRNILNPALTARAFLFFSYPVSMSGSSVWRIVPEGAKVDAVSGATALSITGNNIAASGNAAVNNSQHIQDTLLQAGYSLKTLFFGLHQGSIGETSAFLCFAGALFLIITGIANYRIILGGIAGLIITAVIFQQIPGHESTWFAAGPLYHLFAGGFAFGISFMATDPVSAPGTDIGRWIYGFMIGFLTVLIRAVNPAYIEGVMLSILFMNIFASLIDHITIKLITAKRIPNV